MVAKVQRVDYFYATVKDTPGAAYRLLSRLAGADVSLLAFSAMPSGLEQTQLVLFPEDPDRLARVATDAGLRLAGPQRAFVIQGDDELGALVEYHKKLANADVNVYSSSGVTDGRGGFGYVLYVRGEDYERAAQALGL